MTDEERIERLTELAREVWPDDLGVRVEDEPDVENDDDEPNPDVRTVSVNCGLGHTLAEFSHPHALDALEAALLVLAGANSPKAEAGVNMLLERLADPDRVPAWVEQLASVWEERVLDREDTPLQEARDEMRRCASELRERAKEGR